MTPILRDARGAARRAVGRGASQGLRAPADPFGLDQRRREPGAVDGGEGAAPAPRLQGTGSGTTTVRGLPFSTTSVFSMRTGVLPVLVYWCGTPGTLTA